MDDKQTKAMEQLAKAFSAAKKAGLTFCGMDGDLLAYDKAELDDAETRGSLYDAQRECDQGEGVNTHGTYRDSGGW